MALPLAHTGWCLRQLYPSAMAATTCAGSGSLLDGNRDGLVVAFHAALAVGILAA